MLTSKQPLCLHVMLLPDVVVAMFLEYLLLCLDKAIVSHVSTVAVVERSRNLLHLLFKYMA